MHLKNFSLIEQADRDNCYVLSPAYDLLPVNVIMPEDKEEFALTMNGRNVKLRKKDFMFFAEECGIAKVSAERMIEKILSLKQKYIEMCEESLISDILKERFAKLIEERCGILE